jgi:hypothetical protein
MGKSMYYERNASATVLVLSGLGLLSSDINPATKPIIRSVKK